MIADLWNAPDAASTIGVSTIGSSEACMLDGLALKWSCAVIPIGFSYDLAEMLAKRIRRHLAWFASQPGFRSTAYGVQFHYETKSVFRARWILAVLWDLPTMDDQALMHRVH